jgi:hypothetical protein
VIDVIKAVQEADPGLGTYVIVLRGDSRALDGPDRFVPDAQAWIAQNAPGGRLARVGIRLAPYPGAEPSDRVVTVAAFADGRELAAFATAWTGDPLPEDPDAPA